MRVLSATLLLLLPCFVRAERLPLKAYTVADGLPNNIVNKIVRDSRGFLWFCTAEGLSRFDGYSFTNYGVDQGLPHRTVNDFLETRGGELWVGTDGGLVLFDPRGEPTSRAAPQVFRLFEDSGGAIWVSTVGSPNGLARWQGPASGLQDMSNAPNLPSPKDHHTLN